MIFEKRSLGGIQPTCSSLKSASFETLAIADKVVAGAGAVSRADEAASTADKAVAEASSTADEVRARRPSVNVTYLTAWPPCPS